jgi:hypothetical protein
MGSGILAKSPMRFKLTQLKQGDFINEISDDPWEFRYPGLILDIEYQKTKEPWKFMGEYHLRFRILTPDSQVHTFNQFSNNLIHCIVIRDGEPLTPEE